MSQTKTNESETTEASDFDFGLVDQDQEQQPELTEGEGDEQDPPQDKPTEPVKKDLDEQSVVADVLARLAAAKATQPEATVETPKKEEPVFNYRGFPKEITTLLNSDDFAEREQGLAIVFSAVANQVYKRATEDLTKRIEEQYLGRVQEMIQERYQQEQLRQTVAEDFYGKYPQLNTPDGQMLVGTVAKAIYDKRAKEGKPTNAWDAKIRDEIANTVFNLAPSLKKGAPSPQKPPFITNGKARPSTPKGEKPLSQEIMDVIG